MGAKTKPVYTEIIDDKFYFPGNGEELIPTVFKSDFLIDNAKVVDECFRVAAALRPEVHQLILGDGSFVRDVLCLNEREFKDIVTEAVLSGKSTFRFTPEYRLYGIFAVDGGIRIALAKSDRLDSCFKPVCIARNSNAARAAGKKSAGELHPDILNIVCNGLMEECKTGKAYLEDEEQRDWLDLISSIPEDIEHILDELRLILFSPVKELLRYFKISEKDLARELMISIRTIEDWCGGKTQMKPYTRLLIAQHFWFYRGCRTY